MGAVRRMELVAYRRSLRRKRKKRRHGFLTQHGRITLLLPGDGHHIREVTLTRPRTQIQQLDKLPEAIYRSIVWIRGLFITGQNT